MSLMGIIPNVIQEYVDVPDSALTRETDPLRDLQLNSYDLMSIIGRLESELGVEIAERDVRKLVTLGDLDDYLRAKLAR